MEDDKAEKISVSMPKPVLAAMEMHLETLPTETRSSWLTGLVIKELAKEGMMPGNAKAEYIAAGEEMGFSRALEALRNASRRKGAQVRTVAA
jgi:protoporphyrinogen oxidase